jgi:putative ABC transport system permease protein
VGQKIPLSSSIYPQKNGSKVWTFDLVGIFDGKDETWQQQTNIIYINHDYFDEANAFGKGHTNFYIIKLADGAQADTVIRTVDTLFENSPDETKTQTESDFNAAWVKQIGDIGTMVRWVLFAVFFTLLLVVGNTMAQGVRERVGELAVLKTIGFTDSSVLRLVFAEAITVCGVGGMLGLVLATIAGVLMEKHSGGEDPIRVDAQVWLAGTAAIVLLGIASGLLPALRAQRLQIVDALAGR